MERADLGKAKVLAIFRTEKGQMIIGGKVEEGRVKKSAQIEIIRENKPLGKGEILDLQQSKVAAKDINSGEEFGMKLKTSVKIKEGDMLVSFEEKLKTKTL